MVGNVSTNAITPILYSKKMTFDYGKSVAAVSNLIDVPAFLVVTTANDFPVKSVAELVDYAKKNPGKCATAPSASAPIRITTWPISPSAPAISTWRRLPNKNGASGVIQDMLRGDVQAAFLNVASSAGMVQSGKFRPARGRQSTRGCRIIRTCRP